MIMITRRYHTDRTPDYLRDKRLNFWPVRVHAVINANKCTVPVLFFV